MSENNLIMNEVDLARFLPAIYNLIDRPKTRYDILKTLKLQPSTQNYRKIDECIDMGFLKKKNLNPQTFIADRERIWEFWKKAPIGKVVLEMVSDRTVLPID